MKKRLIFLLCFVLIITTLNGCDKEDNSTRRERDKRRTTEKSSEEESSSTSEQNTISDDSEIKEEKVERDTPPVLLKETYYFSDGSNKKICIEHSTTIYKYNKDGLFIRSNQYFTSGISTESLEKIENDDWSQKYVEYDESGKLIATLRDDGANTRYANIYVYDSNGNLIKEYYNLDKSATLSNIIADNVTNYTYDEKGNQIKTEYCRIKSDGSESCYQSVEYEYDERGNQISKVITNDPVLSTTLYKYDDNNRMISVESKEKGTIYEKLDGYGHRTYFNDENYYCAHEFDKDGRLIKCTYTAPAENHYTYITEEYNEWGQVIKSTKSTFYKWKVNSIADIQKPEENEVVTYIYGYPEDFDLSKLVSEDNFKVEASDMIIDEAEYNRQLETLNK